MKRLSGVGAGCPHAGDADAHASVTVGALAVIDGPAPDHDALVAAPATRTNHDPDFDVAHHESRIVLPEPGGDNALHRAVADLMIRRLDRDRAPWKVWVFEGLAEPVGEQLRPDSLRALVPASGKLPLLPVDEANPLHRSKTVQSRLRRSRRHGRG